MSTDLWGHGWRVAAVDEWGNHARDDDWNYEDPDVDLHMNGGCWDWAIAHQRQNPHLRIGQEWRWNPPEERDDPEEEWTPIHAFTHDDHWAYDARGAFPLSEWRKWKGWDDVTFNHEPRDIGASPAWPGPNPAMDELVSRNRTRPPPPGGGPVFLAGRARHRPHPDLSDSLRAHGTVHTTGGRVLPGRRTAVADAATQRSRLADPAGWSHHVAIAPSGLAVAGARAYASLRGLGDPHDTDYSGIMQSPERVARVGRHYDAMPDHDPAALPHYHAMLKEVGDQYDFMTKRLGIRVQPVDYDPYAHVGEMMADINGNGTLKVLGSHITGGHPVFGNEGNDKFRAVHDFFGHAATGRDFDRHGEHATYLAHARMFSPHAVPALTNETLGQNSSLILNGHFGPQKIGTIPRHHTAALRLHRPGERTAMPTWYHTTDNPNFRLDPNFVPENFAEDAEDYGTCPHCEAAIDEDDPANWDTNDCPECGGSLIRSKPGVFVSDDPERWASPYGKKRDYVAEFDGPELQTLPGVEQVKDSGDNAYFVPADQFHHLKVKGVRPRTAMPAYYHYTEDPDFEPDNWSYPNKYDPETPEGPGIFVAPEEHGEDWSDYGPYRAEFHSPHDLANHPDVWTPKLPSGERFPMEMFVPGHLFNEWEYKGLQKMPRNKEARTMTAAVTVYTKPSCPQCTMTKKLLDRLGVEHDTVDVTADPDAHAYVTGLGYQSAPVVVVGDGESHWSGFKPDHLKGLVSGE